MIHSFARFKTNGSSRPHVSKNRATGTKKTSSQMGKNLPLPSGLATFEDQSISLHENIESPSNNVLNNHVKINTDFGEKIGLPGIEEDLHIAVGSHEVFSPKSSNIFKGLDGHDRPTEDLFAVHDQEYDRFEPPEGVEERAGLYSKTEDAFYRSKKFHGGGQISEMEGTGRFQDGRRQNSHRNGRCDTVEDTPSKTSPLVTKGFEFPVIKNGANGKSPHWVPASKTKHGKPGCIDLSDKDDISNFACNYNPGTPSQGNELHSINFGINSQWGKMDSKKMSYQEPLGFGARGFAMEINRMSPSPSVDEPTGKTKAHGGQQRDNVSVNTANHFQPWKKERVQEFDNSATLGNPKGGPKVFHKTFTGGFMPRRAMSGTHKDFQNVLAPGVKTSRFFYDKEQSVYVYGDMTGLGIGIDS